MHFFGLSTAGMEGGGSYSSGRPSSMNQMGNAFGYRVQAQPSDQSGIMYLSSAYSQKPKNQGIQQSVLPYSMACEAISDTQRHSPNLHWASQGGAMGSYPEYAPSSMSSEGNTSDFKTDRPAQPGEGNMFQSQFPAFCQDPGMGNSGRQSYSYELSSHDQYRDSSVMGSEVNHGHELEAMGKSWGGQNDTNPVVNQCWNSNLDLQWVNAGSVMGRYQQGSPSALTPMGTASDFKAGHSDQSGEGITLQSPSCSQNQGMRNISSQPYGESGSYQDDGDSLAGKPGAKLGHGAGALGKSWEGEQHESEELDARDASQNIKTTSPTSPANPTKAKLTLDQRRELNEKYPTRLQKEEIACQLELPVVRVDGWFTCMRRKQKKGNSKNSVTISESSPGRLSASVQVPEIGGPGDRSANNTVVSGAANTKKKVRIRTSFTSIQKAALEQRFKKEMSITGQERTEFARQFELTEKTVQIWFQNRRMKFKRNSSKNNSESSPGRLSASVQELEIGGSGDRSANNTVASGAVNTKKKVRTSFTYIQKTELEQRFQKKMTITCQEKAKLARQIGLTDRIVKTWFQNRRMKFRRDSSKSSSLLAGGIPGRTVPNNIRGIRGASFVQCPQTTITSAGSCHLSIAGSGSRSAASASGVPPVKSGSLSVNELCKTSVQPPSLLVPAYPVRHHARGVQEANGKSFMK